VRFKLTLVSERGDESVLAIGLERRSPFRIDEVGVEP